MFSLFLTDILTAWGGILFYMKMEKLKTEEKKAIAVVD